MTFRTPGIYREFFARHLAAVRAERAAYEAEVAEWYETGDGAAPRRITEHYCADCGGFLTLGREPLRRSTVWYTSGTNGGFCPEREGREHVPSPRQVNIGGQGHAFPYCIHGASLWVDHDIPCGRCEMGLTEIQVAQGRARAHFERFNDRIDWVLSMPDDLPRELRTQLSAWAGELLPNKIGA